MPKINWVEMRYSHLYRLPAIFTCATYLWKCLFSNMKILVLLCLICVTLFWLFKILTARLHRTSWTCWSPFNCSQYHVNSKQSTLVKKVIRRVKEYLPCHWNIFHTPCFKLILATFWYLIIGIVQVPELGGSNVRMKDPAFVESAIKIMMKDAHHKLQVKMLVLIKYLISWTSPCIIGWRGATHEILVFNLFQSFYLQGIIGYHLFYFQTIRGRIIENKTSTMPSCSGNRCFHMSVWL